MITGQLIPSTTTTRTHTITSNTESNNNQYIRPASYFHLPSKSTTSTNVLPSVMKNKRFKNHYFSCFQRKVLDKQVLAGLKLAQYEVFYMIMVIASFVHIKSIPNKILLIFEIFNLIY